jgi:hypothetical protein
MCISPLVLPMGILSLSLSVGVRTGFCPRSSVTAQNDCSFKRRLVQARCMQQGGVGVLPSAKVTLPFSIGFWDRLPLN